MIKFKYDYCTSTTIVFDDEFEIKMIDNLDNIKMKIICVFYKYNFNRAIVVSNETGEILMEACREGM